MIYFYEISAVFRDGKLTVGGIVRGFTAAKAIKNALKQATKEYSVFEPHELTVTIKVEKNPA